MWRISLCLLCYHQWLGVGEGWKIIICHPIQSSLIRSLLFTLCLLNDCAWLKEASKWSMVLILCMKHGSYSLGVDAHFYHLGSKQVVLWFFKGTEGIRQAAGMFSWCTKLVWDAKVAPVYFSCLTSYSSPALLTFHPPTSIAQTTGNLDFFFPHILLFK